VKRVRSAVARRYPWSTHQTGAGAWPGSQRLGTDRRAARRLRADDGRQEGGRSDVLDERGERRRRESVGWRRGEGGRSAHGEYAGRMVRSYRNSPTVPAAMVCMTAL